MDGKILVCEIIGRVGLCTIDPTIVIVKSPLYLNQKACQNSYIILLYINSSFKEKCQIQSLSLSI